MPRIPSVIVAAFVCAACGSGSELTNPSDPAASLTPFGTMQFTMGTVRYQLPAEALIDSGQSLLVVADGGSDFRLTFRSPAQIGLRSILDPGLAVTLESTTSSGWTVRTPLGSGAGSVRVEALNATTVSGRFAFTLAPFGVEHEFNHLLDGVYNLPMHQVD